MTEQEAEDEALRILGLLEDNSDYKYMTTAQCTVDEDGVEEWFVGVGWHTELLDEEGTVHEYGNAVAILSVGTSIDAVRRIIHYNFLTTMSKL